MGINKFEHFSVFGRKILGDDLVPNFLTPNFFIGNAVSKAVGINWFDFFSYNFCIHC